MYQQYFKFRENPFSLSPDPDFLYLGEQHEMALQMLRWGLANRASYIIVTGEVGTGKTILVRQLLNEFEDVANIGLVSDTYMCQGEMLRRLLAAFGLDHSDAYRTTLYTRYVDFLIDEYRRRRRVVFIVDEAQNLSAENLEELRTLSNVNADKDQLIQLILLGQPELRETLGRSDMRQFAQRISVAYNLEPLTKQQTRGYIAHRLKVAGGSAELFTASACAAVFQNSGGIPRLINRLCDSGLLYAYGSHKTFVDHELINEVIADIDRSGLSGLPELPSGIVKTLAPEATNTDSMEAPNTESSALAQEPLPEAVPDSLTLVSPGTASSETLGVANLSDLHPEQHEVGRVGSEPRIASSAPVDREQSQVMARLSVFDNPANDHRLSVQRVQTESVPTATQAEHPGGVEDSLSRNSSARPTTKRSGSPELAAIKGTRKGTRLWIVALLCLFLLGAVVLAVHERLDPIRTRIADVKDSLLILAEDQSDPVQGEVSNDGMTEQRELQPERGFNQEQIPVASSREPEAQLDQELELAELVERAKAQHGRGDLDEALASVTEGLAVDSEDAELLALREQFRTEVAERERRDALAAERQRELAALVAEAKRLQAAGELEQAQVSIDRGLALEPGHAELPVLQKQVAGEQAERAELAHLREQALEQFRSGEWEAGRANVEQGLLLAPDDAELQALRNELDAGLRVREQQRLERERRVREVESILAEARELRAAGDLEGARWAIDRGLELAPDRAELQALGEQVSTAIAQREREAEQARRRPLQLAELVERARGQHGRGELDEALASVGDGLAVDPEHAELLALLNQFRAEVAARERQEALAAERQRELAALVAEAKRLQAAGELEQAQASIDRGLVLEPGHAALLALQKQVAGEQAERTELAHLREQALEQFRSGEWEAGRANVEHGLLLAPDDAELQALRNELDAGLRIREQQRVERERRAREVESILAEARELRAAADLEGARRAIDRGLELAPDRAELQELGEQVSTAIAQREREAEQARRRRLELAGLVERAKAQHGRGELDEALASVTEGLAVDPEAAELLALRELLRAQLEDPMTPEVLEYMRKGDRYWELGDVASARLFYEAAAASGSAKAMLAVGTTYDPTIATRLGLIVHSNAVLAAKWYRKALEGGAPAAPRHLESLRTWYRKNEVELGTKQRLELEVLLAQ